MEAQIKQCQSCKNSFTVEPEDFEFYAKMGILVPDSCPDCRMKRKLIWRNELTFYKRNCDLCGISMISMYNPRNTFPIYCRGCYFSDNWDPLNYGIDYDPAKPFLGQFKELFLKTPKISLHMGTTGQSVNSDYVNFAGLNKNSYLIFNSTWDEDCSYSRGITKSKNALDIYFGDQAEWCYEGINMNSCNSVLWSQNCSSSLNSYFILDCVSVQNCFGCVNLRHKSYYFFNEPLSKEEWERRVKEILGSHEKIEKAKKYFHEFSLKFPRKENRNFKSVQCRGDYLTESKGCDKCFEGLALEDCKHVLYAKLSKECYDVVGRGLNSELMCETIASGSGCFKILAGWSVENAHDVEYSFDIRTGSNCIGCVGLKHAEFCILNKKYSREEYERIREQIVGELKEKGIYGQFLPVEISPWAYNETLAQENYLLTKEQAINEGFRWEENMPRTKGQETISDIPDNIQDVSDLILKEILKCEKCGNNYRLIASELDFYKKLGIPVPRKCFNCRHLERVERRGLFNMYKRKCMCNQNTVETKTLKYANTATHSHGDQPCPNEFETTYAPDRPEIVYCEGCYQAEVA